MTKYWYRYEDVRYAHMVDGSFVSVELRKYPVLKTTPEGVWLFTEGRRRWVKRDARKRFACPTKREASESFKARKQRQLAILKRQIKGVESALYKHDPQGYINVCLSAGAN